MNVKDKKLLRKRKQEKKIYETKNVLNKKKNLELKNAGNKETIILKLKW